MGKHGHRVSTQYRQDRQEWVGGWVGGWVGEWMGEFPPTDRAGVHRADIATDWWA